MITTTVPNECRLSWSGAVIDEVRDAHTDAVFLLAKQGIEEFIAHLVKTCMTETHDPVHRLTKLQIKVVTLSDDEYRKALEEAYQQGLNDARRFRTQ